MEKQNAINTRNNRALIALQIVIVMLSMAVGYFGHRLLLQYREEFGLLRQARDIVLDNTILDVPGETALEYGMIRGLLGTLEDPYTYFVEPAAHEIH